MKIIKLTKGQQTIVDDDVYEWAKDYDWHYTSEGYAAKGFYLEDGKHINIRLHHAIMGFPLNGKEIDHDNGNRVDNQRKNLKIVTRRKNSLNHDLHRNGRLAGCYLSKTKSNGKVYTYWRAMIRIDGIKIHLGNFKTEQEAHERYMQAFLALPQIEVKS